MESRFFHFELVHVPGTLHTGPDGLSHWTPSPNDPVVDDDMDDWLDRTMGFAVILMNSTVLWTSQLGLSHHPDDQVSCLGWFTAQDSICSAYHQAGNGSDSSAIHIPCSQEAQHADEQLKLIQSILTEPLVPIDLMEAKLWKLV